MKQVIRLTEGDIHRMVNETINEIFGFGRNKDEFKANDVRKAMTLCDKIMQARPGQPAGRVAKMAKEGLIKYLGEVASYQQHLPIQGREDDEDQYPDVEIIYSSFCYACSEYKCYEEDDPAINQLSKVLGKISKQLGVDPRRF